MKKIKRNDEVIVIAGRSKGHKGKVLRVLENDRVIVAGANMVKKHIKPNPMTGQQGGIEEREAPLQVSNVAIYNADSDKADRVGFVVEDGKKYRVFKSSGARIEA
jgi:large subunit ribosomal protein L24